MESGSNSIHRRLMLSFIATAGLALFLSSGAFLTTNVLKFRQTMVRNLSALTRVIGTNSSAPLLFDDAETAREVLAGLAVQESVQVAAIYRPDGEIFARFSVAGFEDVEMPRLDERGHQFHDGYVDLFEPIELDGEQLGTAFIRSNTDELGELVRLFAMIVGVVMIGALFVCYLGANRLRRDIAGPLAELVEGSARLADGDLSVQVEVRRDDELGTLARGFNAMAASLRGLVAQVGQNTRAVAEVNDALQRASEAMQSEATRQDAAVEDTAGSIERINDSIRSVSGNVESLTTTAIETSSAQTQMDSSITLMARHMDELAETIDGTASTVEEMTSGIREIAESADTLNASAGSTAAALELLSSSVMQVEGNARETHTLSEETFRQSEEGVTSVRQTVDGMIEIQTSFHGLSEIISDLSEKSESIGEIVTVIEGVVEQTTLLALNAAIISAQAGEHGRSFSVVAEEVGSLAERTAGSTREIRALIETVQSGVRDAVGAMEQGRSRVDQGVELANQAGNLLQKIGESAHESTARVREIVDASENQARDILKVDTAMAQLRTVAKQLGRGTTEQDSARADILRAVEQIRELGRQVRQATEEQRTESGLISQSIKTVAERIGQILSATREQSKQGDQIMEALAVFRSSADQTRLRREEMDHGMSDLAARAEELEREVERFAL